MSASSAERYEQNLDSDDFASGSFRPHGRSEISTRGNIFRIETEGPFNVEAVAAINKTRAQLLATNPPAGPYAYINRWKVSALMSPEALAEYQSGLTHAYTGRFRAPVAMAWIFPPHIEGGRIMKSHLEKIFSTVGIPFQIFSDSDAAEAWVAQLLSAQDDARPSNG